MRLIPVVDLSHGRVVRAIAGARSRYQVLRSPLSNEPTLSSVGGSLVAQFAPSALYVADLDAIEGAGSHAGEIVEFCASHPELEVWVDSGIARISECARNQRAQNIKPVIGTETLLDWQEIGTDAGKLRENYVLSLDFRNGALLGPAQVLDHSEHWPGEVIVMTLDVVGREMGPGLDTITSVLKRAGTRAVYAAGGVRRVADLKRLAGMGVAGALVSTALHNGQIKTSDLREIAGF